MTTSSHWLGKGIYSVPEASRLSGVSCGRIRRWLAGYKYRRAEEVHMPPVWEGQHTAAQGPLALAFLDLIEAMVIDAFRRKGVSWKVLRAVESKAQQQFGFHHPFCTQRFKTDGRRVFSEVPDSLGERNLQDFLSDQKAFRAILESSLYGTVDFMQSPDIAVRWWPLGHAAMVVVDPARAFGQPIVAKEGVPTSILFSAQKANHSIRAVADWYGVEPRSVRAAIRFERGLAA